MKLYLTIIWSFFLFSNANAQEIGRAKELYFEYSSSKYQVMRSGFSQEYYSYNISKEQEKLWLEELIKQEIGKLDINNAETLFPLSYILKINDDAHYIYFKDIISFIKRNETNQSSKTNFPIFTQKVLDILEFISEDKPEYKKDLKKYMIEVDVLREKYL